MSEPLASRQADSAVDLAAIDWHVRLRDTALSDDDRMAFARWLDESPRHAEAIAEIDRIDNAMGAALRRRADPARKAASSRRLLSRRNLLAAAAGLSAVAVAGMVATQRRPGIETATGQRRQVALGDGGRLELDCGSGGTVSAESWPPQFDLHYGQAFIKTPGPVRVVCPFGAMRAEAASFNLKVERNRALLSVFSGHVAIEGSGPAAPLTTIELGEGNAPPQQEHPDHIAAWRHHRLIFDRSDLADVIDDINRYRPGRIMLADPRLGSLKVTGDFDTRATGDAFNAILQTFHLRALKFGDLVTLVLSA